MGRLGKGGWIGLVVALLHAGCGASYTFKAPENFVVLDTSEQDDPMYTERATNAHGVVLAVRALSNDSEGSLEFWVDAIRNRVRTLGAYALLEETEVRAATGEVGTQLRFGRDQSGKAFLYWVTVFVTETDLYVIEAGGPQEPFERAKPALEQAVGAFEIR